MSMVDVTTNLGSETLSIIIGVAFTIFGIRHLAKVRRTDVLMKIYDKFGSKEIVEA
jgi:hypothetical protein